MQVHKASADQVIKVIKEKLGWDGVLREVYADPTCENSDKIKLSDDYALVGDTVTFKIAGSAENVKVTSHGEQVDFTEENGVYSFTMPEGSVMISADIADEIHYGDIDEDGSVTVTDALLTLQAAVGKVDFSDEQILWADVDGKDGVTVTDALLVLQRSVRKIEKFPVEL